MGVPYSLLNQYRIYERALFDLLSGFLVDYGTISGERKSQYPILTIFSSPERAFARMYQVLVRKGWVAGISKDEILDNAKLYNTVPLPFISIQRREASLDFERSNAPFVFENFEKFPDGTVIDHSHPVPYDYTYEMTLWCKKQYTAVYFHEWIMSLVGNRGAAPQEIYKYIDLGLWGNQLHGFRFEGLYDSSRNAGLLYGFRDYMYISTIVLKGWMFKRPDYEHNRSDIVLQEKVAMDNQISYENMYVVPITRNLLEYISPAYIPNVIFSDASDVTVSISPECYDGRYTTISTYSKGNLPAYEINFNAVGAYARTAFMQLHPYKTIVAIRYVVKREVGNAYMRILDNNKNVVRQIEILPSANWQTPREVFIELDYGIFVEFQGDSDTLIVDLFEIYIREGYRYSYEYIVDSDMSNPDVSAWTALGGAVLSKVVVGNNQALRVDTTVVGDGVSQSVVVDNIGIYVLTADIIDANTSYTIIFTNGIQSDSINITPIDKKIGLVIFTTQNLEVRFEQNAGDGYLILDNIKLRSFKGAPLLQVS